MTPAFTQFLRRLSKTVLTINGAFAIRALRCGFHDAVWRLACAYDVIAPFSKSLSNSTLLTVPSLVDQFCIGRGAEVGAGKHPYCRPDNTVFLDKYRQEGACAFRLDAQCDAACLGYSDNTFDFLFSSHCLEHCPNTLAVLHEWKRVVKPEGIIFLVLPHKERTFDEPRPVTSLDHHLEDYERKVGYEDLTHWEEYETLSLNRYHFWWAGEPGARNPDGTFNQQWVIANGHFHYHVWRTSEFVDLIRYLRWDILVALDLVPDRPDSFLVVARVHK